MTGFIYKLVCPGIDNPIYVGSTISPLELRLRSHRNSIKNGSYPIYEYCRENNIVPDIMLLEQVEVDGSKGLRVCEYGWIEKLGAKFKLLNVLRYSSGLNTSSKRSTVKISTIIMNAVRSFVSENGGSISGFLEQAANEKFSTV